MLVPCQACGRRNNERLAACLYCGEELARSDDVAPPVSRDEVSGAPPGPGHDAADLEDAGRPSLLVLAPALPGSDGRPPPERVSRARIEAVAEALVLDAYLARKALATGHPSVVARGAPGELEVLGRRLAQAGLLLSIVSPAALDAMGEPVVATSLRLPAAGGVAFVGKDGDEWVRPGTARLLVRAELRVQWVGPRPEVKRRLGLREGPPQRHELDQVRSDYPVLEIQRSSGPRVRMHLAQFDFSGLGSATRPSALLNLVDLVRRLRAENPEAVVDDGFRMVPAESDPMDGIFGAFGSNEAQFDRYACIVGAHHAEILAGRAIGAEGGLSRTGP